MARQIIQVIFPPPRFILSLTPMLIFALFFIWRLIWDVLNHLGQSKIDHVWLFYFLGNNRQHRPACAKTISSLVRKVLCVAKAHMSPGSPQGAAASATLMASVSLVSILQAGDWARVSSLARHYFPLTLLLWISTKTLYSMTCWSSVSRSSLGKCQTLTYIQSCICWAVVPYLFPVLSK